MTAPRPRRPGAGAMTGWSAAQEATLRRLSEHGEKLVKFWRYLFSQIGSIDEDDVRDAAAEHGLMTEAPHAQPCEIESCPCEGEWDFMCEETEAVASTISGLAALPAALDEIARLRGELEAERRAIGDICEHNARLGRRLKAYRDTVTIHPFRPWAVPDAEAVEMPTPESMADILDELVHLRERPTREQIMLVLRQHAYWREVYRGGRTEIAEITPATIEAMADAVLAALTPRAPGEA